MLGQTFRNATGLLDGVLSLVNTGLNAGVCGLNTLNQEIKDLSEPQTEAQKYLAQPSLAQQMFTSNKFGKVNIEPVKPKYNIITVHSNVIAFKDIDDSIYQTNVEAKYYNVITEMMLHAKNVLNYLEVMSTGKADVFSLTNGKQSIVLWNDLQNEDPEDIKDMARLILSAIEEVNK